MAKKPGLNQAPLEVRRAYAEATSVLAKINQVWSAPELELDPKFVAQLSDLMVRTLSVFHQACNNLYAVAKAAREQSGSPSLVWLYGGVQGAMKSATTSVEYFLSAKRAAAEAEGKVSLPTFQMNVKESLRATLYNWRLLDNGYTYSMSWLDGIQAEDIRDGYKDILELVKTSPVAKKLGVSRGTKIAVGAVAAAAVLGGGYVLWQITSAHEALADGDYEEDEPRALPVGIHMLGPQQDVIDAEIVEEYPPVDGGIID